jgi:hypothetical protein
MNDNSETATYSPHFALSTTKRRPFEKTESPLGCIFPSNAGVFGADRKRPLGPARQSLESFDSDTPQIFFRWRVYRHFRISITDDDGFPFGSLRIYHI